MLQTIQVTRARPESFSFHFPNPWATRVCSHYRVWDELSCSAGWLADLGLSYPKLRHFLPLLLSAYTVPNADRAGLLLAAKFNSFLFAHDDLLVDRLDASSEQLEAVVQQYKAVLRGDALGDDAHPLAKALADIWLAAARLGGDVEWLSAAISDYFDANLRELSVQRSFCWTLDAYTFERPLAGAVTPVLELALLIYGIELPARVRRNPLYARLLADASLYICVFNDFVSLPKELDCGDGQNILEVCRRSERLDSFSEAARHVLRHHIEPLVTRFERTAELLLTTAGSNDAVRVRAAIQVMRDWMGGHVCWERVSGRHQPSC